MSVRCQDSTPQQRQLQWIPRLWCGWFVRWPLLIPLCSKGTSSAFCQNHGWCTTSCGCHLYLLVVISMDLDGHCSYWLWWPVRSAEYGVYRRHNPLVFLLLSPSQSSSFLLHILQFSICLLCMADLKRQHRHERFTSHCEAEGTASSPSR